MQLSDYDAFPNILPIVVEDELFLYPFMISPIFLNDQVNIDAAGYAIENNTLLFIASPTYDTNNNKTSINSVGVIGSVMRKVNMPDGKVKILFQGFTRGIIKDIKEKKPLLMAIVDTMQYKKYNKMKIDAVMEILQEKLKILSS